MSTVSEILQAKIEEIVNTNTDEQREMLDKMVHIIDLSKNTLKQNLINSIMVMRADGTEEPYNEENYNRDYTTFINAIKSVNYLRSNSLEDSVILIKSGKRSVILVEHDEYGTLLIGGSFGIIQRTIRNATYKFKNSTSLFIRFQQYTEESTGKTKEKTLSQIGHAPRDRNESTSNVSPLSQKLEDIVKHISSVSLAKPILKEIANLAKAHKINVKTGLFKSNLDFNTLNNLLGTGVVIVTLQTRERNNYLSGIESAIMRRVTAYVTSKKFKTALVNATSSNSIIQDITSGLLQLMDPKNKGKVKLATHTNKTTNSTLSTAPIRVGTGGSYESKPAKASKLRSKNGSFASIANLQVIMNQRLAAQIQENMGKGSANAILNNRTGRFAASANVASLTMDREGTLQAFYTYMKYPYQTFEPGFAQGEPKSRDPKLLIAKSIRQIAATLVTSRLKAILV